MPVITQILLKFTAKHDGLVKVLQNEVNRCGCLDLVTESKKLQTPVDHLLTVMRSIDGVTCNDDGMCCAADVQSFADKLKKFRSET